MSESDEEHEDPFDHYFDPAVLLGTRCDETRVHRGREQFAVDFVRHVPVPEQRVLVARALLPPIVAIALRDQLDDAWRGYSEWSMPELPR